MNCSEVMSKRTQKASGEERVTAKSRPMMSLIARAPSNLWYSASESPRKRSYESQSLWSAKAEKYDRTGQPVVGSDPRTAPGHHHKQFVERSYSARYSGWDDDKAWSSQEWKADDLKNDRTETPVVFFLGKEQGHSKSSLETTKSSIWIAFSDMGNVWETITQTIGIPSRIQKTSQMKNVLHICEFGVWTRRDLWSENN